MKLTTFFLLSSAALAAAAGNDQHHRVLAKKTETDTKTTGKDKGSEETDAPPVATDAAPTNTAPAPTEATKTTGKDKKTDTTDAVFRLYDHCHRDLEHQWRCATPGNQGKVKVCHWNNGNGYKEICVDESALPAHLGLTHNAGMRTTGSHAHHERPDKCGACTEADYNLQPMDTVTYTTTGNFAPTGGSYGDPHIKTWLGEIFDFHGECDLVLAHSEQFLARKGLDIHIRTEIKNDWSFISGVALRIGDETLEVAAQGVHFLNGIKGAVSKVSKLRGAAGPATIAGFPITYSQHMKIEQRYEIDLGAQKGKILIKSIDKFLSVSIQNASPEFSDSVGLMGDYSTGNKLGRDGRVIDNENDFGLEWQVREKEPKLFMETKGPQYPTVCRLPEPLSSQERKRRLAASPISYEDAVAACEHWPKADRDTCIYDVLATGELSLAQSGVF